MVEVPFLDRSAAGRALAEELAGRNWPNPVVYALPRGGVPVAVEIARKLGAPLDLLLVRKIGVPGYEELAAGAIVDGERPDVIENPDIMKASGITRAQFDAACARARKEIERRRSLYLEGAAPVSARNATAILVDDGIATGASMRAAIAAVRRREPARVVAAVPVAAPDTARDIAELTDDFVCLAAPGNFGAVGYYYRDFRQLSDGDVIALMRRPTATPAASTERPT